MTNHAEERTELLVTSGESPKRLDIFLANREPALSRSALQRLIEEGQIRINGRRVKPSQKVKPGDRIVLEIPRPQPLELKPEPIPLNVLYEDEALLVLDKPSGLVVHPAPGHWSGTLVNALLHHFESAGGSLSSIGGKERPGIVHRLDKETSGCLAVAKNDFAHLELSRQFAARTVEKIYLALVAGKLRRGSGTIVAAIARHRVHRKKMTIAREGGREARTDFKVVRSGGDASLLECRLHSGRTHQIRVHLQHLGHPILGDLVYGGRRAGNFSRQMLHAWKLGLDHPRTKERMHFEAPLPEDFKRAMREVLS